MLSSPHLKLKKQKQYITIEEWVKNVAVVVVKKCDEPFSLVSGVVVAAAVAGFSLFTLATIFIHMKQHISTTKKRIHWTKKKNKNLNTDFQ